MSHAEVDFTDSVIPAFLVPNAPGAEFAAESHRNDPRRRIMWGLLRRGSGQRIPWSRLSAWTGITNKRELAVLLFRLQREGWLNGDCEPFVFPQGPFSELLLATLNNLVPMNHACILAHSSGLPVAFSGCSLAIAQRLCLAAPSLSPLIRTTGHDATESAHHAIIHSVRDNDGGEFRIQSLYVEQLTFYLITEVSAHATPPHYPSAFVRLMALLGRRYLGAAD